MVIVCVHFGRHCAHLWAVVSGVSLGVCLGSSLVSDLTGSSHVCLGGLVARNKPQCLIRHRDQLAGCHGISCKWFSHKQHGFRLKRMVTQSARDYGSEWNLTRDLVEPALEAPDFEMSEFVEP